MTNAIPELFLVPSTEADAAAVLALMSEDICHNLAIKPINSLDQARDYINGISSLQKWRFSIRHRDHGLIGGLNFTLFPGEQGQMTAVFSYWLGEAYRRQGYAHSALVLLFGALEQQGVTYFVAQVYPHNSGSQKLLQKFGFSCDPQQLAENMGHRVLIDFTRVLRGRQTM